MHISVLDQAPISEGSSGADALQRSVNRQQNCAAGTEENEHGDTVKVFVRQQKGQENRCNQGKSGMYRHAHQREHGNNSQVGPAYVTEVVLQAGNGREEYWFNNLNKEPARS